MNEHDYDLSTFAQQPFRKIELPECESNEDEPIGEAELGETTPLSAGELYDYRQLVDSSEDYGQWLAHSIADAREQNAAIRAVRRELDIANAKYGSEQQLPVHDPRRHAAYWRANHVDSLEWTRRRIAGGIANDYLNWSDILFCEVHEALAEDPDGSPEAFEAELYQVAAVAIRIALANRRKRGAA